MNSKISDNTLHRRSIRLPGYDYSTPGGYYITVVAFRRECLFGEITDGEMKLSPIGEIVRREWFKTADLRPYVELRDDEFMMMPNHAHGIIWIIDDPVRARRRRALTEDDGAPTNAQTSITEQFGKPVARSIPTIVRAFKSAVTYSAGRELNSASLWQPNYYEHVIRDTVDFERIAYYIAQNPRNWAEDEENLGGFINERTP
jgi:putative transposase